MRPSACSKTFKIGKSHLFHYFPCMPSVSPPLLGPFSAGNPAYPVATGRPQSAVPIAPNSRRVRPLSVNERPSQSSPAARAPSALSAQISLGPEIEPEDL